MKTPSNINFDLIVDILTTASAKNDYRFESSELLEVLRYSLIKATGQYSEDPEMFAILFENELQNYVTRIEINDKNRREERRCASVTPVLT